MFSTCTAKIHSHDSLKASDLYQSAADSQFRAGSKTQRFLQPVPATRVTVTGGDSSAPSGISRVQNLALTDPLSRKLAAPAIGLMAVFDQKTPRSLALPLKAPTWPEVMNFANAGNVSTMLHQRTSRWLVFIFALIVRSYGTSLFAKTSVFTMNGY